MCGIVGFVGARADMQEILQGMMDAIAHRGPDGQGQFIEGPAALGQRRLSIIDLEGGKQPMFNEDQNLAVIFNGEIYNFQELTAELMRAGHTFLASSRSIITKTMPESCCLAARSKAFWPTPASRKS